MKFTDPSNRVVMSDDGNASFLASTLSPAALATVLPADPPPPLTKQQKITNLEANITPRRIREAILGLDGTWLADTDAAIKAVRNGP